jgi:hypothetical protein
MSEEQYQLTDTIEIAIQEALSNIHTATIAKVENVSSTTIDVKPVINRKVNGVSYELPLFTEVPPLFLQGGSSYLAHPIAPGDYCLLIITERCFDRWYEGQDFTDPAEFRMHDYSDGIAIVGINPKAGAITIPQVIQMTGNTNQDGDYTHQGDRIHTGNYDLTGDFIQLGNMTVTGNVQVNGNITCTGTIAAANFMGLSGGAMTSEADIISDGISLQNHTHPYTWTDPGGSGSTGAAQ